MERVSGYELARQQAMALFLTFDQQEIAARLGLAADGENLYLRFLGRPYRVERKSGVLRRLWGDGAEGGFDEVLTVYDWLCESKAGCCPAGEYVSSQNLQAVVTSRIGGGMFRRYEAFFDRDPEGARRACEAMGGVPAGKGDIAYAFEVFPDGLSLRLSFWHSDEDFPASLQILWDKNVLDYIRFETTYYAVGFLLEEIMAARS